MTLNPDVGSDRQMATRVEGIASVVLIVGGTFQGVTQYTETAAADVVVYADVQSEVAGVMPRADANLLTLRLATGETLGTLTQTNCPEGLKRFLAERCGVNLNVGLGQLRAVGALVAQQLLDDTAFQDFLIKEILERLLQLHNGCLERIDLQVVTSNAGATGSVVGPALANALTEVLLKFTNATVHVQALRVGSLSFSGLGDRVHTNGAATLAEDVDFVLESDRHPREVRSLMLVENPMVGPQKAQRDGFVLQLMQALRSRQVREMFQRAEPNEALSSVFGTIHILRVSFFDSLSDRRMTTEVARTYETQLDELLRVGMKTGIGDEITVRLTEEVVPHLPTPKELADQVRRAKGVLPPNIVNDCLQSPIRYSCERVLVSISGQLLISLRSLLTMPGTTRAELAERMSVLKALQFKLQQQVQQRTPELTKARKLVELAQVQIRNVLSGLFPESWLDILLAFFCNPQSSLVHFQNLVRVVRQKAQAVAKLQAEVNGLQDALDLVASEFSADEKRIKRAVEMLKAIAGPVSPVSLVRAGSLDPILTTLLETASKDFEEIPESVFRLLASCVKQVTMAGLAIVAGEREARPYQVALALARGKTATRAPAWGGKRHLGVKQRILVLPPMSPEDMQALRQFVAGLDSGLVLAFGDSAQASVNAVVLEVYCPRNADEIFTPFHIQHLRKACEEPDLFFTNGNDVSRWLGDQRPVEENASTKGA